MIFNCLPPETIFGKRAFRSGDRLLLRYRRWKHGISTGWFPRLQKNRTRTDGSHGCIGPAGFLWVRKVPSNATNKFHRINFPDIPGIGCWKRISSPAGRQWPQDKSGILNRKPARAARNATMEGPQGWRYEKSRQWKQNRSKLWSSAMDVFFHGRFYGQCSGFQDTCRWQNGPIGPAVDWTEKTGW